MILFFFSIQSCKNESIDQNYADNDSDGFYDMIDNCPFVPNPDQTDSNSDGIGDFCSDMDDDGIIDIEDNCPENYNPYQFDGDGDGIGDKCDLVDFTSLPCINGLAGEYPCNGYDLVGHLSIEELSIDFVENTRVNDSWGWKDPLTEKEYAIVGLSSHTSFVDMSDPDNLLLIGILPTASVNSIWRDIKVYNDHAYIVSEASNHGMQIFDLKRLRNVENMPSVLGQMELLKIQNLVPVEMWIAQILTDFSATTKQVNVCQKKSCLQLLYHANHKGIRLQVQIIQSLMKMKRVPSLFKT